MSLKNIKVGGTEFITLKDPNPAETDVDNVEWKRTADGGKERAVKYGEKARKRAYRIALLDSTEEGVFDSVISGLSGYSTTFTLLDLNNVSITVRFLAPPVKTVLPSGVKVVDLEMLEVLS